VKVLTFLVSLGDELVSLLSGAILNLLQQTSKHMRLHRLCIALPANLWFLNEMSLVPSEGPKLNEVLLARKATVACNAPELLAGLIRRRKYAAFHTRLDRLLLESLLL